MRLVGGAEAPRLLTVRTGLELTERLQTWTGRKLAELASEDLAGFVFKGKSPSCGPARVKLYNDRGRIAGRGAGLFARACMEQFPLLPVADESQLYDPEIRESFIERLFFWRRWRELLAKKPGRGGSGSPATWEFDFPHPFPPVPGPASSPCAGWHNPEGRKSAPTISVGGGSPEPFGYPAV